MNASSADIPLDDGWGGWRSPPGWEDIAFSEESPDWLGWWESVKPHFPKQFAESEHCYAQTLSDGTINDISQIFLRGYEETVQELHLLEASGERTFTAFARRVERTRIAWALYRHI